MIEAQVAFSTIVLSLLVIFATLGVAMALGR